MAQNRLPAAWSTADTLEGLELVDKAELEGVPFKINQIWYQTNERGVNYVYVDAERADGSEFTFNDSSSGVRAQLVTYLATMGKEHAVDTAEVVPMNLVIPNGLRKSEFVVRDERGREKQARTFYLTTSGRRAGTTAAEPAKPGRTRAARKATAKPADTHQSALREAVENAA